MSLLSAILPSDIAGVKWAKLQRLFRQMADNAGISYALGFPLTDIHPSDTEGIKWQKLGAWAQLIADNIGGGGVPPGPITASGLTMNTARLLGRTTAGSGAVEEISVGAGLSLAGLAIVIAAAQTTITTLTPPGNVLEQHNGVNPQAFNIFNTRTDASNYEQLKIEWASNNAWIYPDKAGSGSYRDLIIGGHPSVGHSRNTIIRAGASGGYIGIGPGGNLVAVGPSVVATDGWNFLSTGHLVPYDTNTKDIGSTSYAVRNLYVGTAIIGGGTPIAKVLSATATLNFGSILAAANEDLTITVTGAAVGDRVVLALPATVLAGAVFNAWVSAADTVTVRCNNAGSIAIDPASATYAAAVIQF